MRKVSFWGIAVAVFAIAASNVQAATPGRERGATSQVRIEGFDPLIPTLRKWYVPQDLYYIYDWGGYKYTNYAKEPYERYVSTQLEGLGQYDIFGNYITRGWRIYEWRQQQPLAFGSTVFKDARFGQWFQNLVVASDSKGQYFTSLTVGDRIRTTLTPLTFSRSRFNGVQWDFASDKYEATVLLSRVSEPVRVVQGSNRVQETDYTNFMGLRGTTQIGDFINLGATLVNTNFGSSSSNFSENSRAGLLTSSQNSGNVTEIVVRIADDSPGDGSGALFFSSQMIVDGEIMPVNPTIEGGRQREGFLEALEEAPILLRYRVPDPLVVQKVSFAMVLSNDYRVEMTSDLQTNINGQPIFLPVTRAEGNVRDNTNQRVVRFDYGLPSANQIASVDLVVEDVWGMEVRGEFARNTQFQRYPNINIQKLSNLKKGEVTADAWFFNATRRSGRWFSYGEAFSMDHDYATRGYITDQNDFVDYENQRQNWFEYIDDNDDNDQLVDWPRFGGGGGDNAVFPGLDENNDLITDFNENVNLTPDYEEPFLRHYIDPPDFLFGVDMNHNTVVDRFENDEEADYPYKKGHRGWNIYGGGELYPGVNITAGRNHEWLIAGEETSEALYLMVSGLRDVPGIGKFEVFHVLKFVEDTISDNLLQWVQRPGSIGGLQPFDDPMITEDTMVNQSFVGWKYTRGNLTFMNKLRFDHFKQRGAAADRLDDSSFIGIINKADYPVEIGRNITLIPRWKNIWRKRSQPRTSQLGINELSEIISLSAVFPVLTKSRVEVGVEAIIFRNAEAIPDPLPPEYIDDFIGKVFTLQYTNRVQYQGYSITSNVGFQVNDINFGNLQDLDVSNTIAFIELFAGLEQERLGGRPAERRGWGF
ncbi:MAG: hypothetical protein HN611_16685 [Gemmatimonadetes bacterium]|jgi:hypothetical protein|nr:hypothetical protein [Gemmatimonadota bacterium]